MCGLDPRHVALRGTEIRACWTAPLALEEAAEPVGAGASRTAGAASGTAAITDPAARRPRTFVPVEELERERRSMTPVATQAALPEPPVDLPAPVVAPPPAPGWSLWGDLEP
jgi:hypothetical protein